jgi:hypothetical protein
VVVYILPAGIKRMFIKEFNMFKKVGFLLVVFLSLNATLFAEEDGQDIGRFFLGGGVNFTSASNGGGNGEFSFLLYHNKLDIRNHFIFRGAALKEGTDNYGIMTLSEKISVGHITLDSRFRVYSFIEGGGGIYAGDEKSFLEMPLVYTFGGGGGTDIFYSDSGSIYFETGYLGYMLGSTYIGGAIFQIGWRGYF